jgi:divalent metal cation (Fe/Co/Zn/Cd) transporter
MDIPSSLAIVALAALIHASFQLSVSVLTLLSGHAIGSKRTHARLLRLTTSFVLGVGVMTVLLLSFISLVLLHLYGNETPQVVWAAGCGILFGIALSVWLFYYRREKGTILWIPRGVADHLNHRSKVTKLSAEAFGLGLSSVLGELLFIIAPLIVASLVLIQLPAMWQLAGIGIYSVISMLSLVIVWVLIGSGHNLGHIQRWREKNKYFLQFSAGAGLIVLGFFVYVTEILGSSIGFK